jgi:hypothetical protein
LAGLCNRLLSRWRGRSSLVTLIVIIIATADGISIVTTSFSDRIQGRRNFVRKLHFVYGGDFFKHALLAQEIPGKKDTDCAHEQYNNNVTYFSFR